MTKAAAMNQETSFLDAWIQRDDLFDRLCAYNPAFGEFRRVLGHEEVAGRLTLADVASMVDSPPEDIAAVANGAELPSRPTHPLENAPASPDKVAGTDAANRHLQELDARPIFANGHEPLAAILSFVDGAPPSATLVIDAPFHPVPLRRLLARRGYRSDVQELAADHWRCTFMPVPGQAQVRSDVRPAYAVGAVASTGNGPTGLILTGVAHDLQAAGHRLAGVVQVESDRIPDGPCDMVLTVLPDGPRIDITQNLGRHAKGCRLDQQALEDAVGLVDRSLDERTELLVINKFGKRESDGAGFRQTIARAVELGVPVLLAVGAIEREALQDYIGEDLITLPEDHDSILAWCLSSLGGA